MEGNRKMSLPSMKRAAFVDANGNEQLAARKMAIFLAEESKISSLAINRLLFLAEVRDICYICMI